MIINKAFKNKEFYSSTGVCLHSFNIIWFTDPCRFFKPKSIDGVGVLQDAGVLQNNPVTLAISELKALYPEASMQYVVNVGNSSRRSPGPQERKSTGMFGGNFFTRLSSAYFSLIKGRKTWDEFRRSIRKSAVIEERCFRLDVAFDGPEPNLDDIGAMPELKALVRADKSLSRLLDEISRFIIASLFYFELESLPEQTTGEFSGSGNILCFRRRDDPALSALTDKLSKSSARFIVNGVEIPGDISDLSFWDKNGNFHKTIKFEAARGISISLKEKGYREYPISGAPFSIQRLIEAQGLNTPFGTADHKRKRSSVDTMGNSIKRRRLSRRSKQ